jgi:hypothetical protein
VTKNIEISSDNNIFAILLEILECVDECELSLEMLCCRLKRGEEEEEIEISDLQFLLSFCVILRTSGLHCLFQLVLLLTKKSTLNDDRLISEEMNRMGGMAKLRGMLLRVLQEVTDGKKKVEVLREFRMNIGGGNNRGEGSGRKKQNEDNDYNGSLFKDLKKVSTSLINHWSTTVCGVFCGFLGKQSADFILLPSHRLNTIYAEFVIYNV